MDLEVFPEVRLFARNQLVRDVRDRWVAAMFKHDPMAVVLEIGCRFQCEDVVRRVTDREAGSRAQIGLLIVMALARRAGGRLLDYVRDLQDALVYARQTGQADMTDALEKALRAMGGL